MTADELISAFQTFIGKGQLEKGFNLLSSTVSKDSDIWKEQILALQYQISELQREYNVGLIDRNGFSTERNSIAYRITNIVRNIEDADIAPSKYSILIICRDDDDEFYMRAFCDQKKDLKCDIKQLTNYEAPTDYDFVIFDNHSIKDIEDKFKITAEAVAHLKVMKSYIEEFSTHQKYMIHFGEMTDVVSKNRDIIYSANSKFSLYSRIKEMQEYIRQERPINKKY